LRKNHNETESQIMLKSLFKVQRKGKQLFCEAWKAALKHALLTTCISSKRCNRPFCPAGIFALAKLPCGVCVMVKSLDLVHDKAEALRRLGIREGSRISLVSDHHPMIVIVENTRIALSHRLASHVKVQALSSSV